MSMQWLSKFILCIAALVVAMSCFAENPAGLMLSPQTSEIITPTPSSAQQIRYQSPQPSLATGAVNLSIPLYTIEAEGLSIPFSLSYHTSGIKPADDPYPCGYGWSMLPALKITRTVRGRADELFDYWGDKFSIASQPDPKLPYACMVATVYPDKFYKEEFTNRYDPEKDIFTISLPSGTYKRIYQKDYDGNISFIGGGADDEIVVTANEGLNDFYVHDSNGFVYHFGRGTDDASVEIIQSEHYYTSNTPTCWGIIDITLPSGRTIDFTWRRYGPAIKEFFGGEIFCDQFEYVNGMANDMSESEKMKAASWKRHHGSHPNYTKMINTKISTWAEAHPNYTAKEAKNFIEELSERLKKQIENGEIKVN